MMEIKEAIVEAYNDDLITETEAVKLFSIITESEVSKVDKDFIYQKNYIKGYRF